MNRRNFSVGATLVCLLLCCFVAGAAFGAADIDFKYDTSGREGTIVEPTGEAEPFAAFDSRVESSLASVTSQASVLVLYFEVFDTNLADVLTNPPGASVIVR